MATGILFMYVDRIVPSVAEKRLEIETVLKPRIQALMESQTFTAEQIASYNKRRLENPFQALDQGIEQYLACRDYLERGLGAMNNAALAQYLALKQRQSFRQHDPVDAFPESQVGPDCPHPRQYLVLFDGLSLEVAQAFCRPDEGNLKNALKRRYRFRFDLLPGQATAAIEADMVPRVAWDPAYMELKNG